MNYRDWTRSRLATSLILIFADTLRGTIPTRRQLTTDGVEFRDRANAFEWNRPTRVTPCSGGSKLIGTHRVWPAEELQRHNSVSS